MDPRGQVAVGVATIIVGLVLGIIVPFAAFGGIFPAPWIVGVLVLPALWGAVWIHLARPGTRRWVVVGQWLSLSLACWWFLGSAAEWSPGAALGGAIFGSVLMVLWMVPVGMFVARPGRRGSGGAPE